MNCRQVYANRLKQNKPVTYSVDRGTAKSSNNVHPIKKNYYYYPNK